MKNNYLKRLFNPIKLAYLFLFIGLLGFCSYALSMYNSGYIISGKLNNKDIEITGQFGDFFGGVVGSLWTLAGVLLYFSALKVQQEQLKAQKEEMKQSEKLLSQQQFESTFFGLLQTQKELKKDLFCKVKITYQQNIKMIILSIMLNTTQNYSSIILSKNCTNYTKYTHERHTIFGMTI